MLANYHCHTIRCGHAAGTEREYVEAALSAGMAVLGFSDHAPFPFDPPGGYPRIRMAPEELEDYVNTVSALREEYAGRITLYIGLESEYYPRYFPGLRARLRDLGLDYLILGQHFFGDEVGEDYCGAATEDPAVLRRYVDQCLAGIETGCFTYFAHPDLCDFRGDAAVYDAEMRRLCRGARDAGLPLEINLLGLRTGRSYPDPRFWALAGEEGCAAILGWDAHSPEGLLVPETEREARALAARCGLRLLDRAALRRPY